jgi:Rod binding domain-containing protein
MNIDSTISNAQQQLDSAKSVQKANNLAVKSEDNFDAASKEFEAMFITQMLKPMFESLEANPVFGGGKGEEVFKGFLLEEYGKSLSKAGGIGLADNVKQEMIRMQEESQI